MRIFIKPGPVQDETRRRRKFLWLPLVIGNIGRCWEMAEWEETYDAGGYAGGNGWVATRWLDIPQDDGSTNHD